MTIWIALGLFVISVAAIAVAVTARSETFAFLALTLVIAGVAGVFAGIATVIVPLARAADPVIEVTRRTGMLGSLAWILSGFRPAGERGRPEPAGWVHW